MFNDIELELEQLRKFKAEHESARAPIAEQPVQVRSHDKTTLVPLPSEDELSELVTKKWREAAPSQEAQRIRSALTFDSGKYSQSDDEFMPNYVWDIADIAAQKALDSLKRESSEAKAESHEDWCLRQAKKEGGNT